MPFSTAPKMRTRASELLSKWVRAIHWGSAPAATARPASA